MTLGNLKDISQMQDKKLPNGRSQIEKDNEPLTKKTLTQKTLYSEGGGKAINIKIAPATLFPEKDTHRCPQVF